MNTHNICFDSEIRKITMLMDIAAAKVLNNPGKLSLWKIVNILLPLNFSL